IVHGIGLAAARVAETDAALIWPGRMVWVDAETVTSLIEAHGADRRALLRPTYRAAAGWPALLPLELEPMLASLSSELTPDELIDDLVARAAEVSAVETGDPGVTHDRATPIDELPDFEGPPQPVAGPAPEWGAVAAEGSDEGPLEGPALAPYGQAAEEGD
ncbi:MAG: hypothetical protein M3253_00370, partial [Chloroflexota bacterium]|nr:hypothetical protein [Chloroflexota bacterium]